MLRSSPRQTSPLRARHTFRLRAAAPAIALLATTAAWGSTFPMLHGVVTRLPVADFLAVRFLLAAVVLTAVVPRAVAALDRAERQRAAVLGLVYGAAQLLQTAGLAHTSAAVSGFVTGSYVVMTPVLAMLLLRRPVAPVVWAATALATVGLGVLSLQGLALGTGEAVTLAGAVFYALHVVGLGAWSRPGHALGSVVVQLWVVTAVCAAGAVPGGVALPQRADDWAVLVFMAVVAGALALVVQTWAQARVAPERAAVVMTSEPVWAAGFAVVLGGEVLGPRVAVGGALVLAAMLLAELPRPRLRRARRPAGSAAGEAGLALGEDGGHGLAEVLRGQERGVPGGDVAQAGLHPGRSVRVEHVLDAVHHQRGVARDLGGHRVGVGQDGRGVRQHVVDQPDALGAGGVDVAAGERELAQVAVADDRR